MSRWIQWGKVPNRHLIREIHLSISDYTMFEYLISTHVESRQMDHGREICDTK